jgi:hypothetical protein
METSDYQQATMPPRTYESEGPYSVWAFNHKDVVISMKTGLGTIGEAVAWFHRFHVGPLPDRNANVVDRHMQMILGYISPRYDDADDAGPLWFGTADAFVELARVHPDQTDVVLWEADANVLTDWPWS